MPVCRHDDVEQRIVDVVVRIAWNGSFDQECLTTWSILDRQGRSCRVMNERHPGDVAAIRPASTAMPTTCPAELVCEKAHGSIIGTTDGLADRCRLAGVSGKLNGQGDRLVGSRGEVVAADGAPQPRPWIAGVTAACLEKSIKLGTRRRATGRDAQDGGHRGGHVCTPRNASFAASVV